MSYAVTKTGTVLRASYGRTMESPYNENLLLSGGYGLNGLLGDSNPVPVGTRNEGKFGIQQALGRWVVADFGYFNKHTNNGYDFGVLFDTPIAFPVAWNHSRINGFTGRVNLVEHKGFNAFVVMAHTNAIFSPPGVGASCSRRPRVISGSTTTRSSTRPPTFSTPSARAPARGWRRSGGTTRAWSPAPSAASMMHWH